MLLELLSEENIQVAQSVNSWAEAVRLAAAPLVRRGSATASYAEAMVSSVEDNGPYIVIDDGLALPHAKPEAGAVRPDIALLAVKDGVDMLGERIYLFAALSAVDASSHLEAMKELAEAVWKGASAKKLAGFETASEILGFLKSLSEEEQ